ncbi:MAG: glycosyltransferase family 2 protein [Sulfolobales archaeon]
MSSVDVSVIVPTYNERENVTRLIKLLHENMVKEKVSYEIVVVDDNSPDGTAEAVRSLSRMYNVKLIVRPGKLGLASAILEGLKVARGSIIAVMDADLQHPPEALPEMLKKVSSECDIVIGSRYVKGGSVVGWSLFRRVISRGADFMAKILLPKTRGIKDTMSGYFVLKRDVIDGVHLDPRGFKILLEIIVKGRFKKVCEHPIEFRARTWGKSKLGIGEVFNYMLHVLGLAHEAVRFVIVGGMGTLVNLATLFFLGYLLSLEHWVTVLVAFEASTLFNFTLHELWTFKTGFGKGVGSRLAEFHGAVALHFVSQVVISNLLFYGYGVERILSQLVGILVGFSLNYMLSRHVIWRRHK